MRIAIMLSLVCALTMAIAAPPPALPTTIDHLVYAACARAQWQRARVGVVIQSLRDGAVWYTRDADVPFIPASTAKVVISAMALEYLPADFHFPTRILDQWSALRRRAAGRSHPAGWGRSAAVPG